MGEAGKSVEVSVVVPALNEAENLPALAERVDRALAGRSYEIIVVDDNSRDNTREVAAGLAGRYPSFRLIVREEPKNGLSGAVLAGLAEARGETLVVMDADLQHPPEKVPELLAALEGGADFVLGSRYVPGGGIEEKWGLGRHINSIVATVLARPFAGKVRDPMSGFFALRRETLARGERLTPLGYKIGLELMSKCRVREVREVPIHFGLRQRGESKLNLTQQFKYLEHLSRLYDFSYPRLSPILKFGVVIVLSWVVGFAVAWSMAEAGVGWVGAVGIGYLFALLVTAVFHVRYVRTQREFLVRQTPWRDFVLVSAGEMAACVGAAWWVVERVARPGFFEVAGIGFGCATVLRYVLRKELMQDVRGLRRDVRAEELGKAE